MEKLSIQFLGGSNEVGKLGMILETGDKRMLFDYGLSPDDPPSYPMKSPPIDIAFLSHCHLDHSGMIPWLCSRNDANVLAADVTKAISEILHRDSIKVAKTEGYPVPYSKREVKHAQKRFVNIKPQKTWTFDDNEIRFHSAGHIPGSLMFEIRNSKKLLFTGDFNVIDTRLVKGTKPVNCDVLVMEATYAGREHPDRKMLEKEFLEKIDEVVRRGGVAVVPVFSVARCQEIALILKNAGYDVWVDGMGKKISKLFLKYPRHLRSEKNLKKAVDAVNDVYSRKGRKLALKGEVILTTSGMLDGGPVLWYLNNLKEDPKNAILLTGYQVEGTNGRLLLEKGKLDFYGVTENVLCEVSYFDFSGHAGHSELVEFARSCNPDKIVLFHSDNRSALLPPLEEFAEVYTPLDGERLAL